MTYDFIGENGLGEVEISLGGVKKVVTIESDERGRLRLLEPIMVKYPHGKQLHEIAEPAMTYRNGRLGFAYQTVYSLGRNNASPVEWVNKSKERTRVFVFVHTLSGGTVFRTARNFLDMTIEEARKAAADKVEDMKAKGDLNARFIEVA